MSTGVRRGGVPACAGAGRAGRGSIPRSSITTRSACQILASSCGEPSRSLGRDSRYPRPNSARIFGGEAADGRGQRRRPLPIGSGPVMGGHGTGANNQPSTRHPMGSIARLRGQQCRCGLRPDFREGHAVVVFAGDMPNELLPARSRRGSTVGRRSAPARDQGDTGRERPRLRRGWVIGAATTVHTENHADGPSSPEPLRHLKPHIATRRSYRRCGILEKWCTPAAIAMGS